MPELEPASAPDRHLLLIDQGNTRCKWIGAVWSAKSGNWDMDVTTFGEGQLPELGAALDSGQTMPPEEVVLSSVASDSRVNTLVQAVGSRTAAPFVRLRSQSRMAGIRNGYSDPARLGTDRWMAILGAARYHGLPLVVMDLGTGTTLDAVDADGRHIGGLILPGPQTMLDSLSGTTNMDLSWAAGRRALRRRAGKPGRNTRAAIEGGVVTAQVGALRQLLHCLEQEWGEEAMQELKIVITGGAAGSILSQSDYPLIHDPLVVFKGMLVSRQGKHPNR